MNVFNTLNQSFLKCVLWKISSMYVNSSVQREWLCDHYKFEKCLIEQS